MNYLTPEELNSKCPYITQDELDYMREEMSRLIEPDASVVMIGSGPGMLTFALMDSEVSPDWNITIIDLRSTQWAYEHYKQSKPFIAEYAERINYITDDSYAVGIEWEDPVDLLIIDGDHTEEGVKRDMKAWLPLVGENGIVFYHDYLFEGTRWDKLGREEYPEVQPFVDEVMTTDKWEPIWRGGCSKVFRMKEI